MLKIERNSMSKYYIIKSSNNKYCEVFKIELLTKTIIGNIILNKDDDVFIMKNPCNTTEENNDDFEDDIEYYRRLIG
jgi:hypothetical protein